MIRSADELAVARARVATLESLLEALRQAARPEEWPALSSGYRLEIERMQGEILDYLVEGAPSGPGAAARRRAQVPVVVPVGSWKAMKTDEDLGTRAERESAESRGNARPRALSLSADTAF